MKVSIKKTGGYAGIEESVAEVDTDKLDPGSAARAKALVGEIERMSAKAAPQIGADLSRYQITVIDGGKRRSISFADVDSPETTELHNFVQQMSAFH